MKKIFLVMIASVCIFASCTSNEDFIDNGIGNVERVSLTPSTPSSIDVFSNGISLNVYRLTRADGSVGDAIRFIKEKHEIPEQYKEQYPNPITAEETKIVIEKIKANEGAVETFDENHYYIQLVANGRNNIDYFCINNQHVNDYNATYGPITLVLNGKLISATYKNSNDGGRIEDNYKLFNINGNYYLGFDYKQTMNNSFDYDGVYDDYIIKLTPSIKTDPTEEVIKKLGGSVEINLSLNEERPNDDYIFSHLSIHVRDTTDVTVTLPIPAEYTVKSDDLSIVKSYKEGQYIYKKTDTEIFSYNIEGNEISLNIEHRLNEVIVSTYGINADVLRCLRKDYNDGITFEVRTYFNKMAERSKLKESLDKSTISFNDGEPNAYVLAKGHQVNSVWIDKEHSENVVDTTKVDKWACCVKPIQKSIEMRNIPTDFIMSRNKESRLWIYPLKDAKKD